ncbi:hypothetical protein COL922a_013042 [Colletotrichum nupharicola]|nr:hypothetical protein COL922a_013042 [Colletotrichum nupharicola]
MEMITRRSSTPAIFGQADIDVLQAEDRNSHFLRPHQSDPRIQLRRQGSAAINDLFLGRLSSFGVRKPGGMSTTRVTTRSSWRDLLQGRCAPALVVHREGCQLILTFTQSAKAAHLIHQYNFPPTFTTLFLENYRPPKIFQDSSRPRDSPRIPSPLIFYSGNQSHPTTNEALEKMRFTSLNLLPLSPLDQIASRIYVRSIFAFNMSEGYGSVTTQEHLQECFHKALARWPFLAGQIRPAAMGRNRLELAYTLDDKALDLARRPDLFRCERINQLGGYTYEELAALGMPPIAMDKDVLSLSPNHPKPGECCPPVTLKVTEMTGGGLFVCFSTHHGIFDGGFFQTFLEYFGKITQEESMKSCSLPEPAIEMQPAWLTELKARPSLSVYENTDIKGAEFPEYDFTDKENSSAASTKTKVPRAVCKIFSFNNAILENLQTEALQYLRETYGATAFVSMADTLSAMVWVHVTRSRRLHLSPSDDTNFTTAADARPRLSPAFPATAWGNIYTHTMAGDQVRNLIQLQENGELPSNARPAIFEAAWLIRKAVEKVKQPDYIPSRIALAAALEDPTMEGAAFRKANQPDHAGLGCSVWVHMGADVDFRIPGTGGKADFVRKTYSANDGSMNIMQRRGITKGDAPWDVLLALREDDMDRVCGEKELGQWTQDWCPRV